MLAKLERLVRRVACLGALSATATCADLSGPGRAALSGSLIFDGVAPGSFTLGKVGVPNAKVSAQGVPTTGTVSGDFILTELKAGPADLTISANGFADTTVAVELNEGDNRIVVEMTPIPDVVLGDTSIRMTAPSVAQTSLSFPLAAGAVDPLPKFTTTGPFTAARGGTSYLNRSVLITATGLGSGSVTVAYGPKTATIKVEAVSLRFRAINIGNANACGIALDNSAWCWGPNGSNQLGSRAGLEGSPAPLLVRGGQQFTQVATSGYGCSDGHLGPAICGTSCALTADGRPWCWGGTPVPIASLALKQLSLRALTPGVGLFPSTCGLGTDGKAWCFNNGTVTPDGSGMAFQSYSAGRAHACGVDPTGDAYCWGSNTQGALGIGTLDSVSHSTPAKVVASVKFSSIDVGEHSTCALSTTGSIYCWGNGFGAPNSQAAPQMLPGSRQYTAIDRGQYSRACGLTVTGEVDCWSAFSGQPTTVPVPALTMISVGNGPLWPIGGPGALPYDACGLTAEGLAYCWRGTTVTKIAQP